MIKLNLNTFEYKLYNVLEIYILNINLNLIGFDSSFGTQILF